MNSSSDSSHRCDTITIEGTTYDITDFKHPGGSIINYVKNTSDATDAFREFHYRSSEKVNRVLQSLPKCSDKAEDEGASVSAREPVLTEQQKAMTADFREDARNTRGARLF